MWIYLIDQLFNFRYFLYFYLFLCFSCSVFPFLADFFLHILNFSDFFFLWKLFCWRSECFPCFMHLFDSSIWWLILLKCKTWGLENGSVVKSTFCSTRVWSQYSQRDSQPTVTPVPGIQSPFCLCSYWTYLWHACIHAGKSLVNKIQNKYIF